MKKRQCLLELRELSQLLELSPVFFSKYNRHLFCVCFVLVKVNMPINSAVREDLLSYPKNCVNFIGKKNLKVWYINIEINKISIAT